MTNLNVKPMPVSPIEAAMLGEQHEWLAVNDTDADVHYALTSGAGYGNTYVVLAVTRNGETVREAFDIRNLVVDWYMAIAHQEATP